MVRGDGTPRLELIFLYSASGGGCKPWGDDMTRPFCPQGYVSSQEAIVRAASQWFAEQIAALKVAAADELATDVDQNKEIQRLTLVETLAWAFSLPQSISETLLCEIRMS